MKPIIKYRGGKSKEIPQIIQYMPQFDGRYIEPFLGGGAMFFHLEPNNAIIYNPQIQISAESETKRSIFREKDKTKRSKKESAQHSKSRNKSFVMTSVSAL